MMKASLSRIEILRAMTHPVRISILKELSKGVKCVSDLESFLDGISQPNISQHLMKLRNAGTIDYFVDGRLRCYFLKSTLVLDLLDILKKDYSENLPSPECCLMTKRGTYQVVRGK